MPLILPALLLAALPFTSNDDKCQPFESSKKLPSVNVLFDSASLVSQLASHENGAADEIVVSINLRQATAHVFGTAT